MSTSRTEKKTFKVNLSKHYKIWFSKSPDVFLGFENQMRLKKMREQSPHIEISLIYSSTRLNPDAQDRLNKFCDENKIKPVDFDMLDTSCMSDEDKLLYSHANNEIQNAISNEHGNLASASDCVRAIIPVIEKCGIYADFDIQVELPLRDNFEVDVLKPVLFTTANRQGLLTWNNDVLIAAHDPQTPDRIAAEARIEIEKLQKSINNNYKNFFNRIFEYYCPPDHLKINVGPAIAILILILLRAKHGDKITDVFSFRKYLTSLSFEEFKMASDEYIQAFIKSQNFYKDAGEIKEYIIEPHLEENWNDWKNHIYLRSVTMISGPGNIFAVLKPIENEPDDTIANMQFSLSRNSAVNPYFFSEDRESGLRVSAAKRLPNNGQFQDLSWTKEGAESQQTRNKRLAATAIVSAWSIYKMKRKANPDCLTQPVVVPNNS